MLRPLGYVCRREKEAAPGAIVTANVTSHLQGPNMVPWKSLGHCHKCKSSWRALPTDNHTGDGVTLCAESHLCSSSFCPFISPRSQMRKLRL